MRKFAEISRKYPRARSGIDDKEISVANDNGGGEAGGFRRVLCDILGNLYRWVCNENNTEINVIGYNRHNVRAP